METLFSWLCGRILPVFLALLALFFLYYLRFRPFRGLFRLLSALKNDSGPGVSPGKAVMMALAGTLGVGNIVGVTDALQKGGPGVLFWMWVSSAAAMVVKYAEVTLALRRRTVRSGKVVGGPMYCMPALAGTLFSFFCILCAFSVGSVLQTSACADAAALLPLPRFFPALLSILAAGALAACLFAGKKRLFDLCVALVPVMSALYLCLTLSVLGKHAASLPGVFREIFASAFSLRAAQGGAGLSTLAAIRYGVVRGLLSNEAGCGTSPMAHARSGARCPAAQGALGVVEVAVDTPLLCTLTGLAVLCAPSGASQPMPALIAAFSTVFGRASGALLLPALLCFAFATLVCWAFYLENCLEFLFSSEKAVRFGQILFCLAAALGPALPRDLFWTLSDLSVCCMTLLCGASLFARRREIAHETFSFFRKRAAVPQAPRRREKEPCRRALRSEPS